MIGWWGQRWDAPGRSGVPRLATHAPAFDGVPAIKVPQLILAIRHGGSTEYLDFKPARECGGVVGSGQVRSGQVVVLVG